MPRNQSYMAILGEGLWMDDPEVTVGQGLYVAGIQVTELRLIRSSTWRLSWTHASDVGDNRTFVYQDGALVQTTTNTTVTLRTKPGERLNIQLADSLLPHAFGFPGILDAQWAQVVGAKRYEVDQGEATRIVVEDGQAYHHAEYSGLIDGQSYQIDVFSVSQGEIRSAAPVSMTATMVTYPPAQALNFQFVPGPPLVVRASA